ncbi:poly glycohydrolase [Ancylostoma caninum]|uniref:Poly glycohydrolase n=1 Tax=Ancylostoma caninum TaxID=29170 RepID=A0A368G7W7_ANCCA|nr:poly glycohydrolase [Ancylostoma caninum]
MINFSRIYYKGSFLSSVRLQCFLNYFSLVLKEMPTGCVSFCRNVLSHNDIPNWKNSKTPIPLVGVTSSVAIEDAPGCLQVDFADEYIGGLVLSSPIDQVTHSHIVCTMASKSMRSRFKEEVRFLICPEMIVSSLLCEKMEPLEAIRIIGAQRYNSYTGYRETFKWIPYKDYGSEPRDEFGRVVCDLAAIDALPFDVMQEKVQYTRENIDRELNKAYAGFMSKLKEPRPVATGNWGCGAFRGNKELKSLIQMLAAAKAGRAVMYCTFNDREFERSMTEQYEKLVEMGATVGAVYKALLSYGKEREHNRRLSVYEHVYDSMRRDTLTGCIRSACTSVGDR